MSGTGACFDYETFKLKLRVTMNRGMFHTRQFVHMARLCAFWSRWPARCRRTLSSLRPPRWHPDAHAPGRGGISRRPQGLERVSPIGA